MKLGKFQMKVRHETVTIEWKNETRWQEQITGAAVNINLCLKVKKKKAEQCMCLCHIMQCCPCLYFILVSELPCKQTNKNRANTSLSASTRLLRALLL
uniref:Uncharacterized protein n=1 Tax=Chelonoidis abingdonii TaxID=106734 RepID=A0A8C0GDC3_CHEAB